MREVVLSNQARNVFDNMLNKYKDVYKIITLYILMLFVSNVSAQESYTDTYSQLSTGESYRLCKSSATAGVDGRSLLVFLYGRGGTCNIDIEASFPVFTQTLVDRGYNILIPELGPEHWGNEPAKALIDQMIDKVLADNSDINSGKIHLMGSSMGAGTAFGYAIRRPDIVQSVTSLCGMTDWTEWYYEATDYYRSTMDIAHGGSPAEMPDAYIDNSAMLNLSLFDEIPIFMVHGSNDNIVVPRHSQDLYSELIARGDQVVYHEIPGGTHSLDIFEGLGVEAANFMDSVVPEPATLLTLIFGGFVILTRGKSSF